MTTSSDDGFLARWSRRKVQARQGAPLPEASPSPGDAQPDLSMASDAAAAPSAPVAAVPPAAATPAPASAAGTSTAAPDEPPPTLTDVAALTRDSDFRRFVAPGVDGEVKNAALKKLFGDPRFNLMDGLDVYIDDYTKPDPLPLASIRKMAQAAFLGLVESTPPAAPEASPTAATLMPVELDCAGQGRVTTPEPDENADLRLQSHDAAGCGGAEGGAAADERRQS